MAAANVTLVGIVNKVLQRLREDTVGGLTETSYAGQVVGFVNDAKREVEQAYNWESMIDVIVVPTVASQNYIDITDGAIYTNERTRVTEVYNATADSYLYRRGLGHLRLLERDSTQEEEPTYYSNFGLDASQNVRLRLYNIPNQVYSLEVTCVNPQDDLNVDDDTVVLNVPWAPVYLRAAALAIRERGDDAGQGYQEVFLEYTTALNDAIAYEKRYSEEGTSFSGDWYVP